MRALRIYVVCPTLFSLLLAGTFLDSLAAREGVPILIHRRIGSMPCELVQRGSLMAEKQFAWIEIEGVNGEVYSPELGPDDYLTPASSIAGSVAKTARRSGFELKSTPPTNPNVPAVEGLNGEAKCPDLAIAVADAEQQRTSKREQLQSRIYPLGSKDVTPTYVSKAAAPPDQTKSSTGVPSNNPKYQGTVVLAVVIGTDGSVRRVRVTRSLSPELDEKATELANRWTFKPARMRGLPVPMETTIEITFHLY
jgi:TonB family protein